MTCEQGKATTNKQNVPKVFLTTVIPNFNNQIIQTLSCWKIVQQVFLKLLKEGQFVAWPTFSAVFFVLGLKKKSLFPVTQLSLENGPYPSNFF